MAKRPPKVEKAERLLFEAWAEPKKSDWRMIRGRKVWIEQDGQGTWILRVERLEMRKFRTFWINNQEETFTKITSTTRIKLEDGDVDAIFDALVMVKDLMNRGVSLKSTLPPEEKKP